MIGESETNATIEFNEIYQTDSVTVSLGNSSYIGIESQSSEGIKISSNTIRDIALNGGVTLKGIFVNTSTSLAGMEINGNTIKNLDLFNAGLNQHEVYGIDFNATDVTDSVNIYNNFIHDLRSASLLPTSKIYGIRLNGGRAKVYNNIISLGTNQPSGVGLAGIFDASTVAGNQHEIYFNTIYLGGSVTTGANTAALWLNSETPAGRKIYNNILSNHRTNTAGSAQHFAAYITGTPVLETDFNNYYANGTGGHLGYYNTAIDTITDWRLATHFDCNSFDFNPDLTMPGGDSIHHFKPQMDTVVGTPITGITTDIEGSARNATPAMGAIEIIVTSNNLSTPITMTGFSPAGAMTDSVVIITGHHLLGVDSVFFNGILSTSIEVVDSTMIRAVVPASTPPASNTTGYIRIAGPCGSDTSSTKFYQVYFEDGTGTANDPYLISEWGHLNSVRFVEGQDVYFQLTADLDSNSTGYDSLASSLGYAGSGWLPIGDLANPFNGHFDGNQFTIKDMVIDRPAEDHIGLFGVADSMMIENLTIHNAQVEGRDSVGTLVGFWDGALMEDSITNVYITQTTVIGGSGADTEGNAVGGLGGVISNVTAQRISVEGSISGNRQVGGLVGAVINSSSIIRGGADIMVTNTDTNNNIDFGGAFGKMSKAAPTAELIYVKGSVAINTSNTGSNGDVGGLVGLMDDYSMIRDAYSRATVTGPSANGTGGVGGFAGSVLGDTLQIVNSYSTGEVDTVSPTGGITYGGFVGTQGMSATVEDCFWDGETTTATISAAGTEQTPAEMKDVLTFALTGTWPGWDFADERVNGDNDYWGINDTVNNGYPFLMWEGFPNEATFRSTINIVSGASSTEGWRFVDDTLRAITTVEVMVDTLQEEFNGTHFAIIATDSIVIDAAVTLEDNDTSALTMRAGMDIIVTSTGGLNWNTSPSHLIFHANADTAEGGMVYLMDGSSIQSGGGHVWIGGGSGFTQWNGLTVGDGSAIGTEAISINMVNYVSGVVADGSEVQTGGGDLYLAGMVQPQSTVINQSGVYLHGSTQLMTQAGDLTIIGGSEDTNTAGAENHYGIIIETVSGGETLLQTTSGNLNLMGTTQHQAALGTLSAGIALEIMSNSDGRIVTTSGNIHIKGIDSSATSLGGIYINNSDANDTLGIFSQTGDIFLEGRRLVDTIPGITLVNYGTIGYDSLTTYSGNITLITDSLYLGSNSRLTSNGILTIQPFSDDLTIGLGGESGQFTLPQDYFTNNFSDGFTKVIVGQTTGTGLMQAGSLTVNDPLTLRNGTGGIRIVDTINMVSDQLILETSGLAMQSLTGAIRVEKLAFSGSGNFVFDSAYNAIDTFAAGAADAPVTSISLLNQDTLIIGSVNPTGIHASGTISIATLAGDLIIQDSIITTNNDFNAIRLYADSTRLAGDGTGGNIQLLGVVQAGTSGRGMLFGGELGSSAGILDSLGADRLRFNIDAQTTTFSPNLGNGIYGLFRDATCIIASMTPSGSGTTADPYLISAAEELLWITEDTGRWDQHYRQTQDIDAAFLDCTYGGAGWNPIGNSEVAFTGSYDGGDYSLANLQILLPDSTQVGLFGLTNGAVLKNINLVNFEVEALHTAGVLAGQVAEGTQVERVFITNDTITTTGNPIANTGLMIGVASGNSSVFRSKVTGQVEANGQNLGGIVGLLDSSSVAQSIALAGLQQNDNQGGTGGLVGATQNKSYVANNYANIEMIGVDSLGGLIGLVLGSEDTIAYNYVTGTIAGSAVTQNAGLVVRQIDADRVIQSFWNTESTGLLDGIGNVDPDPAQVYGKDTTALREVLTFALQGWDFDHERVNGVEEIWGINDTVNAGFPFLMWEGWDNQAVFTGSITVGTVSDTAGWGMVNDSLLALMNVTVGADTVGGYLEAHSELVIAATDSIIVDESMVMILPANSNLTMEAGMDVIFERGDSVFAQGGVLNMIIKPNADDIGGGMIWMKPGSGLITNGGHIWMGGGSGTSTWNALAVGSGFAEAHTLIDSNSITGWSGTQLNGITLDSARLITNDGDIYLAGRSTGDSLANLYHGILLTGNTFLKSRIGNIELNGVTEDNLVRDTLGSSYGVQINASGLGSTLTVKTTTGNIQIEGTTAELSDSIQGAGLSVFSANNASFSEISSLSGNIDLKGYQNSSDYSNDAGMFIGDSAKVYSTSGMINLTANAQNTEVAGLVIDEMARIGQKDGTSLHTGSIRVQTDKLQIGVGPIFQSMGAIYFDAYNQNSSIGIADSFGQLFLPGSLFSENLQEGFDSITIGSGGLNFPIYVGKVSVKDHLILQNASGNLFLGDTLDMMNNQLTLAVMDSVIQRDTAAIFAQKVALKGPAQFELNSTYNEIDTLAGGETDNRIAGLSLTNQTTLVVGSVNPVGIYSTGPISIATIDGDIVVSEDISTLNASNQAIQLFADSTRMAGDSTGGQIILVNDPELTTGTVGRASLYTGNQYASTGVWDYILDKSFSRFDVDVRNDSITPSLSSGTFALYRDLYDRIIDMDGDGVPDDRELIDGTLPLDSCSFLFASVDTNQVSEGWKLADCDGDGVLNIIEMRDGTDPAEICSYNQDSWAMGTPIEGWFDLDCDGDGVLNGIEIQDGSDELSPCDFIWQRQENPDSSWINGDCDGDGILNGEEFNFLPRYDGSTFIPRDLDQDSIPNFRDLDADGDGVLDSIEYHVDSTNAYDACDFVLYNALNQLQSDTSGTGFASASAQWLAADCDQDGVSNYQEILDDTDPLDICSFDPSSSVDSTVWKISDCDGDGVTNEQEQMDSTDLNNQCDFLFTHVDSLLASEAWKLLDCDGDGVSNIQELRTNDNGADPCDLLLDDQGLPTAEWEIADCDGDGISNGEEVNRDGTDPFDPCDYDDVLQALESPTDVWLAGDCDGDGVTNGEERDTDGTDLKDPCSFELTSMDTSSTSEMWKSLDCDGDGVNNGIEILNNTDPSNICDWVLASIVDSMITQAWMPLDCDGDGQTNEWEISDEDGDGIWNGIEQDNGLDWMDSCSFIVALVDTLEADEFWKSSDCDGDGITNLMEVRFGSNPLDGCSITFSEADIAMASEEWNMLDCDGDSLTNQMETNLMGFESQDVDGDGIPNFLDEDSDGDGMSDADERVFMTDPYNSCSWIQVYVDTSVVDGTWKALDCDGDGVTNYQESVDETDGQNPCEFIVESRTEEPSADWLSGDCDADGLTNEEEGVEDTDGNGVPDFLGDDSDGDGVSDSTETADGTNRLDNCSFDINQVDTSKTSAFWNAADCDGDGVPNLQEIIDDTNPLSGCGFLPGSVIPELVSDTWRALDCDNDSLTNGQEGIGDTDGDGMPDYNDRDSDWDGMLDEDEYSQGTDPKNPCSFILSEVDTSFASVAWKNSDCDGDGVPNIIEVRMVTDPLNVCDFFVSAIVDSLPVTEWNRSDCDGDGIDNDLEGYEDVDGDGLENFRDEDADGDGVPDSTEIRQITGYLNPCEFDTSGLQLPPSVSWNEGDCDEDGWTNEEEGLEDIDGDGVANYLDDDSDGDGVPDSADPSPYEICDYDENLIDTSLVSLEWRALDCDGDGVSNLQEWLDSTSTLDGCDFNIAHVIAGSASEEWESSDCDQDGWTNLEEGLEDYDQDGMPNFLDEDADGDGVTDAQEEMDETGFLNPCDFEVESIDEDLFATSWEALDCDEDGILNLQEYLNGDTDEDGIPDLVDEDSDGDGVVDSLDSNSLDGCIFDSLLVDFDLTALSWRLSDCDGDGVSNGMEWEDQTGILQPCNFIIESVDSTSVSEAWLNGDCDGDGILNGEEGYADFDGDEIPAFLDLDSDNDGVLDEMDACMNTPLGDLVDPTTGCSMLQIDADGDRVPDDVELLTGTDPTDGCSFEVEDIDDQLMSSAVWDSLDCDGDGIANIIEGVLDLDGDEMINLMDTDADGDGVLDSIEYFVDGTSFVDPCDFEIQSISETVSNFWLDGDCDGDGLLNEEEQYADTDGDGIPNYLDEDSDGDGVTDSVEVFIDFTDHLSTCSFVLSSITITPSTVWMSSDCDGDGISNDNELKNDTDPLDICSFDVDQIGFASFAWSNNDCDGDGVANGTESKDGTDPLDPCSLLPSSVHLTASEEWLQSDCDGDGIENQIDGLGDIDEDGTPNFLDLDTDMDGILDAEEGLRDINRDSIYDFLQPNTMPDSTDEVKVYSGISPNGDGMNDFLIIYGSEQYPDNKLSIYNRWGNLIYEESGYGHNGVFFEGYASGSSTLLPDGVYYYVFEYRVETREVKMVQGFFQVYR